MLQATQVSQDLLNLTDYTPLQIGLFGVGCFGWVIFYGYVVRGIIKNKFVEIPAASVMTNIAWEFVWGFLFAPNMGLIFVWGYRVWFVLDVYIAYSLFKYGDKQISNPVIKKYFKPITAIAIVTWVFTIYFFVAEGYDRDTPGLVSGYILNVIVAVLYILLILKHPKISDFSYVVAWSKMLGTAIASVFCFWVFPDMPFMLTLCVLCFILDTTYILTFRWKQKQTALP